MVLIQARAHLRCRRALSSAARRENGYAGLPGEGRRSLSTSQSDPSNEQNILHTTRAHVGITSSRWTTSASLTDLEALDYPSVALGASSSFLSLMPLDALFTGDKGIPGKDASGSFSTEGG